MKRGTFLALMCGRAVAVASALFFSSTENVPSAFDIVHNPGNGLRESLPTFGIFGN